MENVDINMNHVSALLLVKFGKVCKNCNKRNNFAMKCKSKKMREVLDNDSESDIFLNSIETKD